MSLSFYSRGKLLITGEYLVLHGAKALAIPLNVGQFLNIEYDNSNRINWSTFELGKKVFSAVFDRESFQIIESSHLEKSEFIKKILKAALTLNHSFLVNSNGFNVIAKIEFDMNYGFGTSSTLINNIAQFTNVNPFELNRTISKGSGYDIACADANSAITYQLKKKQSDIQTINWNPSFFDKLNLVHLNKKMATENNISQFLNQYTPDDSTVQEISSISEQIIASNNFEYFMQLIDKHEEIVSKIIKQKPVKQALFSGFEGSIKSLGAWGGDFVLVASTWDQKKQVDYFNNNGYKTVIPFNKLIINPTRV